MAVKIRLRPQGRNNRAFYRVVVTDSRAPSDGKYVEAVGWYDPMAKEESSLNIKEDRIRFWLERGAQLTDKTEALVARAAPEVIRELNDKAAVKRNKSRLKRKAKKG
jgi:small subunit ribosomal protein S16